jgi:hypothetical protein
LRLHVNDVHKSPQSDKTLNITSRIKFTSLKSHIGFIYDKTRTHNSHASVPLKTAVSKSMSVSMSMSMNMNMNMNVNMFDIMIMNMDIDMEIDMNTGMDIVIEPGPPTDRSGTQL